MAKLNRDFTRVMILDRGEVCEVVDHLSSQFTVETHSGRIEFLFYADRGVTWELAD